MVSSEDIDRRAGVCLRKIELSRNLNDEGPEVLNGGEIVRIKTLSSRGKK